ncbi:hypothetical protein V6Z11_A06G185900 [Gossypium hirsutum]
MALEGNFITITRLSCFVCGGRGGIYGAFKLYCKPTTFTFVHVIVLFLHPNRLSLARVAIIPDKHKYVKDACHFAIFGHYFNSRIYCSQLFRPVIVHSVV